MSASAPLDHCPRCGQPFHCGAGESRCDCFDLKLGEALRARLAREFSSCLCLACLRQLQAEEAAAAATARPAG